MPLELPSSAGPPTGGSLLVALGEGGSPLTASQLGNLIGLESTADRRWKQLGRNTSVSAAPWGGGGRREGGSLCLEGAQTPVHGPPVEILGLALTRTFLAASFQSDSCLLNEQRSVYRAGGRLPSACAPGTWPPSVGGVGEGLRSWRTADEGPVDGAATLLQEPFTPPPHHVLWPGEQEGPGRGWQSHWPPRLTLQESKDRPGSPCRPDPVLGPGRT